MAQSKETHALIGDPATNFWLHSSTEGYDLTHPSTPTSEPIHPRLPIETATARVTIDPSKSALVIIDMQNFFLSPALGRPADSKGLKACDQLLRHAIPAARKAGIRVVWLNWGLTEDEVKTMPPSLLKAFGFQSAEAAEPLVRDDGEPRAGSGTAASGKDPRLYRGLGSQLGPVKMEDGSTVEGGRLLMRDQWNAALYHPLEEARQQGTNDRCQREDVWIHKNRMSGMWGGETECSCFLEKEGIKTLLFAGVNTDQCVLGTLQDSFSKGYDCVLLSDGCATTSPAHSQDCVEFNAAKTHGFLLSCEDLAKSVTKLASP